MQSTAIIPLLELALSQTNGQGAYVHRFTTGVALGRLAACVGLPAEGGPQSLKRCNAAVVLHEHAWSDWRFAELPEFRRHRFHGVASIPLLEGGEVP